MFFEDIKSLNPIYSTKYGKGTIVSIQWRKTNQLMMCYFKSLKRHVFLTSDEIKNDASYSLEPFKIKEEDLKENVVKNKKDYSTEDF